MPRPTHLEKEQKYNTTFEMEQLDADRLNQYALVGAYMPCTGSGPEVQPQLTPSAPAMHSYSGRVSYARENLAVVQDGNTPGKR